MEQSTTECKYKVGDWVEIISHIKSNVNRDAFPIGYVFQIHSVHKSELFKGDYWIYINKTSGGILSGCLKYAKNHIVQEIIKDL